MDLLVLGRAALSSQDTLLSSGVMYYTVQAGPFLVLHVSRASIMGMAAQLLHTQSTRRHTHTIRHMHLQKKKKKKECCKRSSIRSTKQHQRQHWAEMYKNPQYVPSLSNHEQSYLLCFCWGASQWVCSAVALSSWVPDWAFIANWCIVKHWDTLCCRMGCVLLGFGAFSFSTTVWAI